MAGGRFIRVSTPVICARCARLVRGGRLAYWELSSFTCYSCVKRTMREAPTDPEETAILDGMVDEEDQPVERKKGGRA
jgi:hypothetical protein